MVKLLNTVTYIWLIAITYYAVQKNEPETTLQLEEVIAKYEMLDKKIDRINSQIEKLNLSKSNLINESIDKLAVEKSKQNSNLIKNKAKELKADDPNHSHDSEVLSLAKKMQLEEKVNPVESAALQFNDETIDFAWASEYEYHINTLFAQNVHLSNMTFDQVSCRSSICRISIFDNGTPPLELANNLAKALKEQEWRDPNATFVFEHSPKDGRYIFFIGRGENSIAF